MKLLKLTADGLALFKGPVTMDFFASGKIMGNSHDVRRLKTGSSIGTQTAIAITGLNATGKTTLLRIIELAVDLITGESLSAMAMPVVTLIPSNGIVLKIVYTQGRSTYLLESHISAIPVTTSDTFKWPGTDRTITIKDETLSRHDAHISKSELENPRKFNKNLKLIYNRRRLNPNIIRALGKERSIATLTNSDDKSNIINLIDGDMGAIASHLVSTDSTITHVFDRSVDRIRVDKNGVHIKFAGQTSDKDLAPVGTSILLSVGTVRGIKIIQNAIIILMQGGYLLVDEIENSLNKKLVEAIIDMFRDPYTNPHNAVLIFTTHYPELLDHLDRSDSIWINTRSQSGVTVNKLSDYRNRNDLQRSTMLLSNHFGRTVPDKEDLKTLCDYIHTITSTK